MARKHRGFWPVVILGVTLAIGFSPEVKLYARGAEERAYPPEWDEIHYDLYNWNPARYKVSWDGVRQPGENWPQGFGWFCYQVFVDPGPIRFSSHPWNFGVSEKTHYYFKRLTAAWKRNPLLKSGLSLLFDNLQAFARNAPLFANTSGEICRYAEIGPLSSRERASLSQVAAQMRRAVADGGLGPEVKAAAHLIIALTEGDESSLDSTSVEELMRIPQLYTRAPLTGFLSQYYLYMALLRRHQESGALTVAKQALSRYAGDPDIAGLSAYADLKYAVELHEHPQLPPGPSDTESYPNDWQEIRMLDAWNPAGYSVGPDGMRLDGDRSHHGFGWFCYQVFVDPGVLAYSEPWVHTSAVPQGVRDYFRLLTVDCARNRSFGKAARMLFENLHLLARSVRLCLHDPRTHKSANVDALSQEERARLLEIAEKMRSVVADESSSREIRAAAHLIAALTAGGESAKDSVNTQELMRLPILYPDQELTGFLSQYYLLRTLMRRGKNAEALQIAKQTEERYSGCRSVRDLEAYGIVRWVTHPEGSHE